MTAPPTVTLQRCSGYWRAQWWAGGKQHGRSLGNAKTVPKPDALAACREIERRLGGGAATGAPALEVYLRGFQDHHPEFADGTKYLYSLTARLLVAHFGGAVPIDAIDRPGARAWRAGLACAESTRCRHAKEAKAMFAEAVEDGILALNPFAKLASTAPARPVEFVQVDGAALERILEACLDDAWRLLLALCRLAGLRRGEALDLRWGDVDMLGRRMTVNARAKPSTKKRVRVVPIAPRLHDLLFAASMTGGLAVRVVAGLEGASLHRQAVAIMGRAGLAGVRSPFHSLRKCRENEWLREFPPMTVCEWIGHSPAVAKRYYHQVSEGEFQRASGA